MRVHGKCSTIYTLLFGLIPFGLLDTKGLHLGNPLLNLCVTPLLAFGMTLYMHDLLEYVNRGWIL